MSDWFTLVEPQILDKKTNYPIWINIESLFKRKYYGC